MILNFAEGVDSSVLTSPWFGIAAPLSNFLVIINSSITSGKFPSAWKKACVAPLHKKSDKFSMKNYRPVALLDTSYKILELENRLEL